MFEGVPPAAFLHWMVVTEVQNLTSKVWDSPTYFWDSVGCNVKDGTVLYPDNVMVPALLFTVPSTFVTATLYS